MDDEADACHCIDCSRRRRQLTAAVVISAELDYAAAGLAAPGEPTRETPGTEWEEELQQRRSQTTYGPPLDPRRRLGDAVVHDAASLQEDTTEESARLWASSSGPDPPTPIDWTASDLHLDTNPWRSRSWQHRRSGMKRDRPTRPPLQDCLPPAASGWRRRRRRKPRLTRPLHMPRRRQLAKPQRPRLRPK